MSRVACETLVTTDLAVVAGEITTKADADAAQAVDKLVRDVIREIGYVRPPSDRLRGRHLPGRLPHPRPVARTSPWAWTPAAPATRA